MSEIEESKQRPEVDETKRQQDEEKIRNEAAHDSMAGWPPQQWGSWSGW